MYDKLQKKNGKSLSKATPRNGIKRVMPLRGVALEFSQNPLLTILPRAEFLKKADLCVKACLEAIQLRMDGLLI